MPESPVRSFSLQGLKNRFGGSGKHEKKVEPLPGEKPFATLRIQVLGGKNMMAADLNGKSDPYVTITLQRNRHKTPVAYNTLNPTFPAKQSTFDYPIYKSVAEKLGTLIEFIVWDKDILLKDYLGEVSLGVSDWFKHPEDAHSLGFTDSKNKSFWADLEYTKSRKQAKGSLNVKIGFVAGHGHGHSGSDADFAAIYAELVKLSKTSGYAGILSAPATHGVGTIGADSDEVAHLDDNDDDASSISDASSNGTPKKAPTSTEPKPTLPTFRLNWQGTKIDYSFSVHKDIAGVLLLEIKGAVDLPPQKHLLAKGGWDLDPFVVISFGKKLFRTRIIRHSLTPEWNEKLLFHVQKSELLPSSPAKVGFSILDWDKITEDDHVGDASLHLGEVMKTGGTPVPDERTGLFVEDLDIGKGLREFRIPIEVNRDGGFEVKNTPYLIVEAKYEPHASFRQRFWRHNLGAFDADSSKSWSAAELLSFLHDLGFSHATPSTVSDLFKSQYRDAGKDQLSIDETVRALEGLVGAPVKWERDAGAGATKSTPETAPAVVAKLDTREPVEQPKPLPLPEEKEKEPEHKEPAKTEPPSSEAGSALGTGVKEVIAGGLGVLGAGAAVIGEKVFGNGNGHAGVGDEHKGVNGDAAKATPVTTTATASKQETSTITFVVDASTNFGENIYLTGSIPELKNWSPENAIGPLANPDHPRWSTTVTVPANTAIHYKYIRKIGGHVEWETDPLGPNAYLVSPPVGQSITTYDSWRSDW